MRVGVSTAQAKSIGDMADGLGVFLEPRLSENYDRVLLGVCYPSRREVVQGLFEIKETHRPRVLQ